MATKSETQVVAVVEFYTHSKSPQRSGMAESEHPRILKGGIRGAVGRRGAGAAVDEGRGDGDAAGGPDVVPNPEIVGVLGARRGWGGPIKQCPGVLPLGGWD